MRFFACLAGLLLIAQTSSGSTLLAESFDLNCCGTFSTSVPRTIVGGQFHFGYDYPFEQVPYADGTFLHVIEEQLAQHVGGNLFLAEGEAGVFDVPALAGIVAKLTDGVDEFDFTIGNFGFNTDRIVAGGGWYTGSESGLLGLEAGQDLAGNTIDFFRLIVDEVSWGATPDNIFWTTTIRGKWQVYGTPIPEPSTALLVAAGLLVLATRRRGR